ncbi:PAAR domain-containing protein [Noviherbaspirillum saxi]|nr:PAAR domain-containing protein [Noviherbaspirillum saxi]
MSWLLTGLLAGAAIGVGTAAIIGTGGLAAAAIVGGLAATGGGLGDMLSTMSWAPKETCGVIKGTCSGNVFVNGLRAARAHADVVDCSKHASPYLPIASGSATVYINGQPAARINDKVGCSAVITGGSGNVFIGGNTVQTDVLHPEKLVPDAVHAALFVVGLGSAIVIGGPIIATAGFAGGAAGQLGGEWIGGKAFGVGSDGQKWAMFGGAMLGGAMSAKGGAVRVGKWSPPSPSTMSELATGGMHQLELAARKTSNPPALETSNRMAELHKKWGHLNPNERRALLKAKSESTWSNWLEKRDSEAATVNPNTHFLEKHGPNTTLLDQEIRATTRVAPDGSLDRAFRDSTRFMSARDMGAAMQRADSIFHLNGSVNRAYSFQMEGLIGEGFTKAPANKWMFTTNVNAVYRNGHPYTMFPLLRPIS